MIQRDNTFGYISGVTNASIPARNFTNVGLVILPTFKMDEAINPKNVFEEGLKTSSRFSNVAQSNHPSDSMIRLSYDCKSGTFMKAEVAGGPQTFFDEANKQYDLAMSVNSKQHKLIFIAFNRKRKVHQALAILTRK